MQLETIIGLEIHIQIKTKSKMFCSCQNVSDNEEANTSICPICLGHPGTLPVANKQAVEFGILMASALNCRINKQSIWARKNYFYPDLSKGYQISQFRDPLAEHGHLIVNVKGEEQRIAITRLHLEEDAAKNFHSKDQTLLDYNRAGTPLMEIVTEPDFRSPAVAKAFLQELRLLARYLGVSDADMEKGHLRCDANISLRPVGETKLYSKTENKNLNSFKAVERALEFEVKRQKELWQKGQPESRQSTRGWDEQKLKTFDQRDKEESADYRYFPEPDLPPLVFMEAHIREIKSTLPELPQQKRKRLITEYGVKPEEAKILVDDKDTAVYFEKIMMEARNWLTSLSDLEGTSEEIWTKNKNKIVKLVIGWLTSELFKLINESGTLIRSVKITPENFAEFITLVYQRKVNSSAAQVLLREMFETGGDPSQILEEKDLKQVDNQDELEKVVKAVIKNNPAQVKAYQAGKTPLIKYFIGQAMKETKGKADPEKLEELLLKKLE